MLQSAGQTICFSTNFTLVLWLWKQMVQPIDQNLKSSSREETVHESFMLQLFCPLANSLHRTIVATLSCQVRKCYYVHPNRQNKLLLLLSSTLTWMSNSRQATAVFISSTQISNSKSTPTVLTAWVTCYQRRLLSSSSRLMTQTSVILAKRPLIMHPSGAELP